MVVLLELIIRQQSLLVMAAFVLSVYYLSSDIIVPAILMGPEDMILEYNDVLTATFTCTAFGGNDTPLEIDWLAEAEVTGFNVSSRTDDINADNSTTSSITTLPLSLSDRGATYTCDVAYASPPKVVTDALATVDIGEYTCNIKCK